MRQGVTSPPATPSQHRSPQRSPQISVLDPFPGVQSHNSLLMSPQSVKSPFARKKSLSRHGDVAEESLMSPQIKDAPQAPQKGDAAKAANEVETFREFFRSRTREVRHPMTFPIVQADGKMHLPPSRQAISGDDVRDFNRFIKANAADTVVRDLQVPQLDWSDGRLPPARSAVGIMTNAMKTITLSKKQAEAHVTLRPVRDVAGWYFHDVTENTFLSKEVVCNLGDHVDIALRLSGLIKQLASHKTYTSFFDTTPVVYDEGSWTWQTVATRLPIADGKPNSKDLVDRVDMVPTGIISVVGNLQIGALTEEVKVAKRPNREAARQKRKANVAHAAKAKPTDASKNSGKPPHAGKTPRGTDGRPPRLPSPHTTVVPSTEARKSVMAALPTATAADSLPLHVAQKGDEAPPNPLLSGYDVKPYDNDDDDEQMIMVIGDPDSEFLSTAEVLKFIKHYLTRAVIKAARTAGASVVCDGTGDVVRQLSIGYQAFLDPVGIKGQKAAVNTQLVGISARCDSDVVSLDVSHNVLLQCDGGHVLSHSGNSKYTDSCSACGESRIDPDGFCTAHRDWERLRATSVDGKAAHPTADAIRMFKLRMLESMHNGHNQQMIQQDAGGNPQAPNRDAIPIMIIVFGGATDVTRREVHTAAQRGWPILIVEGSGGYADILCSTINKINSLSPDASSDDYRKLLTTVDPETSAIIANGNWQIIRRGTEVGQVERLILTALKGDEILHQAWKWYSSWHFNQLQWAYYHQLQQLAVLMLGIFATLASVTQTFLILLYRERSTESTFLDRWGNDDVLASEKYWYMMFRLQQWLVIGLPITLTLVHAIFQRMNPWAKVSAFRVAASSLLCEIYMYRTRTVGYSTEAVKRNSRADSTVGQDPLTTSAKGNAAAMKMTQDGPGGAKMDAKVAEETSAIGIEQKFVYSSREELLGHRMRKIQATLGASEAGLVRLEENIDKSIPPSDITKNGDGGLADLTPDAYVKFRVSALRRDYWKRHRSLDRQQSMLTALVIFFGATGTALAALSAYGLGYLQAWVAFSTVVVNSLTRFLDFTRIAAMAELCNTAEHQLGSVERWWSSVGTDADSDKNRMKLVTDAEHAIRSELEGWSKQMQSMDDDDEEDAAKGAADARADAQLVDDAATVESKALGTDLLKSDTILRSLQDSGGNLALKVKRQILDLNDKLGGFIKPPPSNTERAEQKGQVEDAGSALGAFRHHSSRVAAPPTFAIPQVFLDHNVRGAFLDLLRPDEYLDYRSLSGFSLRQALGLLSPRAAEVMSHLRDTLHVTAIAKRMILDEFEFEFQSVLDGIPTEVRHGFTMEDFATAMARAHASFASQLRFVTKESLAQILDHVAVKEAILLMKLSTFTEMIQKCITGFTFQVQQNALVPLPWKREEQGSLAYLTEMLKGVAIVEAVERVHVRILNLGSEDETRHLAQMIDLLNTQSLPLDLISQEDLLSLVPKDMFADWRSLSGLQLSQNMRVIACGTAASRCVRASRVQLEAQTRAHQRQVGGASWEHEDHQEGLFEWINEPTRREVLVAANEFLTQIVINRSTKTDLIRAMQATKAMTKDFADSLNAATSEHSLKGVLSTLQAQQSNSFASMIVQRLADSFFLVDYNDLLSGDEVECLVTSVSLVPSTFAVGGMTKEELLNIVPLPTLRRHLEGLDEDQLRRLYMVQRLLLSTEYSGHVWNRVIELGGVGSLVRQHMLRTMHPHAAQRLIFRISYMSLKEMQDFCQFLSLSKLLQQLGDAVVTQALFGVCVDPTQEHNYATELGRMIEDIYNLTHVTEELGGAPTIARPDDDDEDDDDAPPKPLMQAAELPERTSHPLLVRMCHRLRTVQGRSHWVDLFFRMDEDYLSVDLASLNRLVDMKADKLHLIDLDDENPDVSAAPDNVGVEDIMALFALDSDPARYEDCESMRRKLMEHRTGEYVNAIRVKQTLVEMDIFLDLEFPYLMFEEIAQMCTQFDLRDVVVNSTDRHVFAVSWLEFLIASDENVRALCDVTNMQLVDHDADLAIPANKQVAEEFKSRLLGTLARASAAAGDANSDLKFGDMDLLLSSVRSLHDAHVVQLAVVIDTLFRSTAGLVFQWYCDNRRQRSASSGSTLDLDGAPTRHQLLSLEQVASHILCIARGNQSSVEEALCRYDATQFYHTKTTKRVIGVLKQTIPNDVIVDTLLRMDVAQLNWLFIMIQFTLDGEQRCMREDEVTSKLMKKRFAEKLKSNRFSNEGTRVLSRYLNESPTFEDDFN